jgi:hypothetical protein
MKTTRRQEKKTCKLTADFQISQVKRCREVIDKKCTDGLLNVAFASRPAGQSKRKKTQATHPRNCLSGSRQACTKQQARNQIWNGNECKPRCRFNRA